MSLASLVDLMATKTKINPTMLDAHHASAIILASWKSIGDFDSKYALIGGRKHDQNHAALVILVDREIISDFYPAAESKSVVTSASAGKMI